MDDQEEVVDWGAEDEDNNPVVAAISSQSLGQGAPRRLGEASREYSNEDVLANGEGEGYDANSYDRDADDDMGRDRARRDEDDDAGSMISFGDDDADDTQDLLSYQKRRLGEADDGMDVDAPSSSRHPAGDSARSGKNATPTTSRTRHEHSSSRDQDREREREREDDRDRQHHTTTTSSEQEKEQQQNREQLTSSTRSSSQHHQHQNSSSSNNSSSSKPILIPTGSHGLPPKPTAAVSPGRYPRERQNNVSLSASSMSVPSRGDKVPERSNSRSNGSRGPGDNKDKEQTNADKQEETGELLPLWEPRISASNGRTYYYNTETFQSTWKRPSVPASTESTKPQPPPSASRDNDTRQESQSVASADRHAPRQEESSRRLDRRDTAPTTAALSTAGSAADPSSSWSRSSRRRSPSPPPAQADRERERVERSRDQEPVKPSRRPNGQRSAVDDSERALHHTPSPFTTPRERNVDLPSHQQPQSRRPDPNVDNLERYFPAVTESTDRYIGTAGKEILRGQRGDRSDRDRDRERERTRTSDEKPSNRRGRSPETFEAQPQESSHQTSHSRRGRSDEDSHNYEANNIPSSTPRHRSSLTPPPLSARDREYRPSNVNNAPSASTSRSEHQDSRRRSPGTRHSRFERSNGSQNQHASSDIDRPSRERDRDDNQVPLPPRPRTERPVEEATSTKGYRPNDRDSRDNKEVENDAKRRRIDESTSDSTSARRESGSADVIMRSPEPAAAADAYSRRKRVPLPPQTASFRQDLHRGPPSHASGPPPRNDGPPSAAKASSVNAIPLGPRGMALRDASHPDFANQPRPPSGPSHQTQVGWGRFAPPPPPPHAMPPFAPQMTPQVVPSPVANPRPITPETPDRDVDMDIDPPKYSAPPYPASSRHTERESRRSDNYDLPKGPRAPVPIEPEEPVHKPAPFLMPAPVPQYSHGRDGGRREPRARTPPPPPARARTPPVSANLPYRPERRSEDVDSMSGPSGRDDRETRNRTEAPKPSERSDRHEERRPAPPPVSLSVINGDRRRASSPSSTEAQPPEGGRHRHGRRAALSGSNVTPVASLRAWGKPKVQTEPSPVAQVVQPPPNPPPKQNGIKFDDRRDRERNERHERPSPLVREDSLPFESTPPPQPQRVEKKREPTPPIQERLPTRPDRSDADLSHRSSRFGPPPREHPLPAIPVQAKPALPNSLPPIPAAPSTVSQPTPAPSSPPRVWQTRDEAKQTVPTPTQSSAPPLAKESSLPSKPITIRRPHPLPERVPAPPPEVPERKVAPPPEKERLSFLAPLPTRSPPPERKRVENPRDSQDTRVSSDHRRLDDSGRGEDRSSQRGSTGKRKRADKWRDEDVSMTPITPTDARSTSGGSLLRRLSQPVETYDDPAPSPSLRERVDLKSPVLPFADEPDGYHRQSSSKRRSKGRRSRRN